MHTLRQWALTRRALYVQKIVGGMGPYWARTGGAQISADDLGPGSCLARRLFTFDKRLGRVDREMCKRALGTWPECVWYRLGDLYEPVNSGCWEWLVGSM